MKYYAMIDGEQKGPFELEQLPEAGVRPSTYIWHKGLPDWQKAEDDADVCRLFRNHLYDIMHPEPKPGINTGIADASQALETKNPSPTRFDSFLKDSPEQLPTIEEIESRRNTDVPPVSMIGYAWLVTILCFFPTGIVALVYAYRSKSEWDKGLTTQAHDSSRQAKMWTGITFFLGLIGYAFLFAFF